MGKVAFRKELAQVDELEGEMSDFVVFTATRRYQRAVSRVLQFLLNGGLVRLRWYGA